MILSTPSPSGSGCIGRSVTSQQRIPNNLAIGEALGKFYQTCSQRIVHVMSAGLAHTHACDPTLDPWFLPKLESSKAFAPTMESILFDEVIIKWAKELNTQVLLEEAGGLVSKAKVCGFDGLVILHGAIKNYLGNYFSEVLYYAHPSYYGMIVALIELKKHKY